MATQNQEYWKNKLLAFLHDPPHKPYGIANHEATLKSNLNLFGLNEEDFKSKKFEKYKADSFAASADRFCFPNPRRSWNGEHLKSDWIEAGLPFIHPFCGTVLKPHERLVTKDVAQDWMSQALSNSLSSQEPSKSNYIKGWRLWEKNLVGDGKGARAYFPYLVADTRIPDHTIWQHNALVSALSGCDAKPAFLIFQIGPVQSFIAQAKTTRDLWAGSYILSYLNSKAIEVVSRELGPDHVIFPQLKGNPMMDQHLWDFFGDELEFSDEALQMWKEKQLLVPSLPNRFLAIVPSHTDIEQKLRKAVTNEWNKIATSIKQFIQESIEENEELKKFTDWDCLWDEQIKQFPRIEAIVVPFGNNTEIIKQFKSGFPPVETPADHSTIQAFNWAQSDIFNASNNHDYYDSRNYKTKWCGQNNYELRSLDNKLVDTNQQAVVDNMGSTWALQYMKAEWQFGALRASREFQQRFDYIEDLKDPKRFVEKDALDGINEVLGGKNSKAFWHAVTADKELSKHFHSNQRYGAISIIKRLFDVAFLNKAYGFPENYRHRIKSTHEVASNRKGVKDYEQLSERDCKYYAVICLDGDSMGSWLSGDKSQPVIEQLSGTGIKNFFKDNSSNINMKRTVSPSYHATFSESLANFANYCVEPIVSEFSGQLIYAGGDDVLAMLPMANALDCSEALQLAFRGLRPTNTSSSVYKVMNNIFDYEWSEINKQQHADGFLKLKHPGSARPKSIMILPGPKSSVSVGIAIGHIKSPMQDVIQVARDSEQVAKNSGKDGFCLTIKKRSGETNSFFSHWNHAGESTKWMTEEIKEYSNYYSVWNELFTDPDLALTSSGTPYVYTQYISPLLKGNNGKYEKVFDSTIAEACEEFLCIVLERQTKLKKDAAKAKARHLLEKVNLRHTTPENFVNFWMCYAFIKRNKEGGQ